jgi:hypothetical protein
MPAGLWTANESPNGKANFRTGFAFLDDAMSSGGG